MNDSNDIDVRARLARAAAANALADHDRVQAARIQQDLHLSDLAHRRGLDVAHKNLLDVHLVSGFVLGAKTYPEGTFYRLSGMVDHPGMVAQAINSAKKWGITIEQKTFSDGVRYVATVENVTQVIGNNGYAFDRSRDTPTIFLHEATRIAPMPRSRP